MDYRGDRHDAFVEEFAERLDGYGIDELQPWYARVKWLVNGYVYATQLEGDIFLVPDNNIVQDFKHRDKEKRNLLRLSYLAFSRFAKHWSPRASRLAISPVIVYEHIGRQLTSPVGARVAMESVFHLFSELDLPIHGIGYRSPKELSELIQAIHDDAAVMAHLVRDLDTRSWAMKLRRGNLRLIPLALADEAAPKTLSLSYFDPWYVRRALCCQIEQRIIKQSREELGEEPLEADEYSKTMAELNKISSRQNFLTGLGDLDLLQTCDLRSQHQNPNQRVMLGQTFDQALSNVLRLSSRLVRGTHVEFGQPETAQQVRSMVDMILRPSQVFQVEQTRMDAVVRSAADFRNAALGVCRRLLK